MAIAENGPGGNHRGKLGNIVYYQLNGKNVSRIIGESTKEPTEGQLSVQLTTKLSSKLFKRLHDFIKVGFGVIAREANDNAFNQAVKYNKKGMMKGSYPDLKIAYDSLQISKGPLNLPEIWQIAQVADGLQYTWATDPLMSWPQVTDQVMTLAYFPLKDKVVFNLFGSTRASGSDVLEIVPSLQSEYMETYMSFISADRSQVANSIYTGSFNLDASGNLTLTS
jgi:hypothetical protein